MAKRFRLRISWAIPSFKFCRSKDDAATAASPAFQVSPVTPNALHVHLPLPYAPPIPPCKFHARDYRRRRVPVVTSSGCRCVPDRSNPGRWATYVDAEADDLHLAGESPPAYLWRREDRWHVVARVESSPRRKIDSDDGGRELFPPLPVRRRPRRTLTAKKKKKRKSKTKSRARVSTSSADSHWFSSEDEEAYREEYDYDDETELLMSSSRSFSTDYCSSPETNPRLKPICESPDNHVPIAEPAALQGPPRKCKGSPALRRATCPSTPSPSARGRASSASSSVPRRFTMTPLGGIVGEGKVSESFAVEKRSEDPYGDFRRSMVEMVVENQMYEEDDLEQLLHCFLLLNTDHHHPAIFRAFSDIWAALFPHSHRCTSSAAAAAAATPPPPVFTSS